MLFEPAVKMPAVVWPVISKFSIVIPSAPLLLKPRARTSPPCDDRPRLADAAEGRAAVRRRQRDGLRVDAGVTFTVSPVSATCAARVIVRKGAAELPAAESSPEGLTVYVAADAPAGAAAKTTAMTARTLHEGHAVPIGAGHSNLKAT